MFSEAIERNRLNGANPCHVKIPKDCEDKGIRSQRNITRWKRPRTLSARWWVRVRDEGHVQNKAMEGQKEVPGLWVAQNEGAKFWLQVLTELQNRGVKDIFIYSSPACMG
jgi:hypothetical protein